MFGIVNKTKRMEELLLEQLPFYPIIIIESFVPNFFNWNFDRQEV